MLRKPIDTAGREKLEAAKKGKLRGAMPPRFKPEECTAVLMQEYAITDAHSKKPVVGSPVVSSGLLMGLYDSENKRAGCANIAIGNDVQSLEAMMPFFSLKNTVAHLVGGNEAPELCLEVIELLEKKEIRIVNAHIEYEKLNFNMMQAAFSAITQGASIAIDARNGQLYSPVHCALQYDDTAVFRLMSCFQLDKMNRLVPLKLISNSLQEEKSVKSKKTSPASETPSFHGLQGNFLNSQATPATTPKTSTAKSSEHENPTYSGLRRGFLNNNQS